MQSPKAGQTVIPYAESKKKKVPALVKKISKKDDELMFLRSLTNLF